MSTITPSRSIVTAGWPLALLVLGACASATPQQPAAGPERAVARIISGDDGPDHELVRDERVALVAVVGRMRARIDAIRDEVRQRQPGAGWLQLVCLEAELPAARAFVRRGQRAYTSFHTALRARDPRRVALRAQQLSLALAGAQQVFTRAKACAGPADAADTTLAQRRRRVD